MLGKSTLKGGTPPLKIPRSIWFSGEGATKNSGFFRGVPASEIPDPNPVFQFAPLPTTHYVILHHYNDIHNCRLIIHGVNYIHAIPHT